FLRELALEIDPEVRLVAQQRLAWRKSGCCVPGPVTCILGLLQQSRPRRRIIPHVATQVMLQNLIHSLRLPIGLWVERCREAPLDPAVIAEGRPERTREQRSSIGDDTVWRAEVQFPLVVEQLRQACSVGRRTDGEEPTILS